MSDFAQQSGRRLTSEDIRAWLVAEKGFELTGEGSAGGAHYWEFRGDDGFIRLSAWRGVWGQSINVGELLGLHEMEVRWSALQHKLRDERPEVRAIEWEREQLRAVSERLDKFINFEGGDDEWTVDSVERLLKEHADFKRKLTQVKRFCRGFLDG